MGFGEALAVRRHGLPMLLVSYVPLAKQLHDGGLDGSVASQPLLHVPLITVSKPYGAKLGHVAAWNVLAGQVMTGHPRSNPPHCTTTRGAPSTTR